MITFELKSDLTNKLHSINKELVRNLDFVTKKTALDAMNLWKGYPASSYQFPPYPGRSTTGFLKSNFKVLPVSEMVYKIINTVHYFCFVEEGVRPKMRTSKRGKSFFHRGMVGGLFVRRSITMIQNWFENAIKKVLEKMGMK